MGNKLLRLLTSAFLLGTSTSTSTSFAISENPIQQFKIASAAQINGRFDTALQEFNGFVNAFPNSNLAPQARLAIGEILFSLKKYTEASEAYAQIIKKNKGTYEAMNAELRLGQCEFNMKKYLQAIDNFTVVKENAPKALRSEALLGIALSYMALKSFDKAEIMLSDLLQAYPKYNSNPAAVVPLGLILMRQNRFQESLKLFSLLPDNTGALYYKGVVLRLMGQTIAAAQILKDVYEAEPKGFWADKSLLQVAEAYYKVNEFNLAYDSFRKVYDRFPTSPLRPYALHRMASIHFHLGRFQEAGIRWEELIRTFSEDISLPHAVFMLGEMALRQEEYGKAISYFSQISKQNELRMDAQFKIIWCLAQQKQDDMAVTRSNIFLKEYPWGELTAKVLLLKGICLQRMKKYLDANGVYQIVIDQFGKSAYSEKALFLMSTSLYQNQQLAEIVTSLNSALKMQPVSSTRWQAETYLWVAEAYYALNQFDVAERNFQLIVDNYKDSPKQPFAMLGVAASLAEQGKFDEAAVAHEKALVLAESLKNREVKKSVLMDTAQVFFTKKRYDKALSYFDEFTNRYPDDPQVPAALFQAGVCLYRQEFYDEAAKRWKRIIEKYPNHELAPKALYESAKTSFGLGKYDEAKNQFQLLIENYPKYENIKDARIQVAQCYYNQGQFDVSAKHLEEFLNNYPKDPKAKDVLELLQMAHYRDGKIKGTLAALTDKYPRSKLTADIYWQSGAEAYNNKQYKQALEYFRKLVGEFPESPQVGQAYYYMAESHFALEEYPNAVVAYKNFILNFPDHPNNIQSLFRFGVSNYQTGNYSEAVIAFNDVLEKDPKGPFSRDALINTPLCYKKMSQPAQAISAHERFLRTYPDDPDKNKILLEMGALSEETKSYEKAIALYAQIPEDTEESFAGAVATARLYRLLKSPSSELAAYEKLRLKQPFSNEARLTGMVTLAEIYQEQGQIDEAVSVYEDIAKNSSNPDWKQAAIDRARALRSQ